MVFGHDGRLLAWHHDLVVKSSYWSPKLHGFESCLHYLSSGSLGKISNLDVP